MAFYFETFDNPCRNPDVLCGCGWGRMNMPEDQIPDFCPQCWAPIGIEGRDLYENPKKKNQEPREDVLCGCGWGRLSVPVSQIPEFCPMCGAQFNYVEENPYMDPKLFCCDCMRRVRGG